MTDKLHSDGVGLMPQNVMAAGSAVPKFVIIAAVAVLLFVARDVLVPLSIAVLIAFALSPLVSLLRRRGLPHVASVMLVVTATFIVISGFFLIVASQMAELAQNLPTFQANILTKVESLQAANGGDGIVSRFTQMVSTINAEIGKAIPVSPSPTAGMSPSATTTPMVVEVVAKRSSIGMLQDLVLPLISPIATAGLVVVVVVFMLLEREELRDRFIRLVGSNDLHRTTQVLEDASHRVGQYLLIQLLVNVIYALPVGVGLWLIGVPNPVLWGMLTLVLRFVPYIGAVMSAAFPLFLAFAVAPGWSAVLWTLLLFGALEFITSNIIEPWLFSARTGISPLAIILAAIFWAWIWGPLGMILSTPLTVCLVVLGRHIPQFEVFDIVFGNTPVLAPHTRLYQRLLAGDVTEAAFRAAEALETLYLADYYDQIAIPALLLAQNDYARGVLTVDQGNRFADVSMQLVDELSDVVAEEIRAPAPAPEAEGDGAAAELALPDGTGCSVICVGARSRIDDVAAVMLAQVMQVAGAQAVQRSHTDLVRSRLPHLATDATACLVLTFLDSSPSRASLLHVRRLKLAVPGLRVGVVILQMPSATMDSAQFAQGPAVVPSAILADALAIGADFAVTSLDAAILAAFSRDVAVPVLPVLRKSVVSARRRTVPALKVLPQQA